MKLTILPIGVYFSENVDGSTFKFHKLRDLYGKKIIKKRSKLMKIKKLNDQHSQKERSSIKQLYPIFIKKT